MPAANGALSRPPPAVTPRRAVPRLRRFILFTEFAEPGRSFDDVLDATDALKSADPYSFVADREGAIYAWHLGFAEGAGYDRGRLQRAEERYRELLARGGLPQ